MAHKALGKQAVKLLLGKCLPTSKDNAVKIAVSRFVFDEYLLHHFVEPLIVYANDPNKLCKTGDTVLIQTLPNRLTRLITHEVLEIIHPLGDVTDPITGKKVIGDKYRDEIEEINELSGKVDTAFDYKKAPSRGSQENKRDFTAKKTYVKYQDDKNIPQPYAW